MTKNKGAIAILGGMGPQASAKLLEVAIEAPAVRAIAERSRATPRVGNYLLKRCRDFAQLRRGTLTEAMVGEALELLGIDALGLTASDRAVLETLIGKFGGGPVGLNTLAAALSEEEATIEEVSEPYLLQLGLIERTPRGRRATPKAYEPLRGAKQPLV